MPARALMILGDSSDAGKSVITAALARAYTNRGLRVAPFKPQNMSNNAAALPGGGEIGRAQALQALAARRTPHVDMNPVLLKPQADRCSQVVIQGQAQGMVQASDWRGARRRWMIPVLESFARLAADADLVLVEGAGSPAETNLRAGDIANLGFARAAGVPAIIIGDIDRGGVIASLVGTSVVLEAEDRACIRGFLINKFRGDPQLFADGLASIAQLSGWPALGILPWQAAALRLPREDAQGLAVSAGPDAAPRAGRRLVVIPTLSRIANFDDFAPLLDEPALEVRYVAPGEPLPRTADLILLPGTKSTLADLAFLRAQGWDIDILAHVRAGGRVFGVCGGFQMLGRHVHDPDGLDGAAGSAAGLGLLAFSTHMQAPKITRPAQGRCAWLDCAVSGYEIHAGQMQAVEGEALFELEHGPDGLVCPTRQVAGAHLHGLFGHDGFRAAFLGWLQADSAARNASLRVEAALDELAAALEQHLDLDHLLSLSAPPGWSPSVSA
ncbi:MAG: cobyric acid synthase [Gammaproteobacteria bacterium]|nr:cobyric acid synthase [Gammaproteobacteria bacterium]